MYGYIYKTTNLVNGKFYIGKHKSSRYNPSYLGSGNLIKNAIKEYGSSNFDNKIIDIADSLQELNDKEKYWIKALNAREIGYNIGPGGDGGQASGWHHTEETKKLIGSYHKGVPQSDETKAKYRMTIMNRTPEQKAQIHEKYRASHLGYHHSESQKRALSEKLRKGYQEGKYVSRKGRPAWNKGIPATEEVKKRLSQAAKNKIHITNGTNNKMIYPNEFNDYQNQGWRKGRTINKHNKED